METQTVNQDWLTNLRASHFKLYSDNLALLRACRAFVEQAAKVQGFPQAYEPYLGALVLARTAIEQAESK